LKKNGERAQTIQLSMEDDLTLWKNIREGDAQALKELHDRYYYQMCLYALKMYHCQNGMDEAVSDCFIKLWTKRIEIVIERSVKSYLYLMLRNSLIDLTRKKNGTILLEINALPELPDNEAQNEYDNYARLYKALEKLPEQRRRILELAVFESFTYAQIAEKLQISINTVKTQIGRAYRFLKEELDPRSIQLLFLLKSKLTKN
jgi:RNA polymerase sigma-70 factor (ECF subfamily)